jgi:hypothetical protein
VLVELIEALGRAGACSGASEGLFYLGLKARTAVPALLKALDSPAETKPEHIQRFRESIVQALGAIGPGAEAAAPRLSRLAQDKKEDEKLRDAAVRALTEIGRNDASVAILVQIVEDKKADGLRRLEAIRSLAGLGPKAAAALPALRELAATGRRGLAGHAQRAIEEIERDDD